MTVRFRTVILSTGKTALGFIVLPEAVGWLVAGRRPPVRVTINGYSYRALQATGTKNPETRARGIEKSVAALRQRRIR